MHHKFDARRHVEKLDLFNVFNCTGGKKIFILLDGHHSSFKQPFQDYVHNPEHEWRISIGVPYGTYLWYKGNSEAPIGLFSSITITKAIEEHFHHKLPNNKSFSSYDSIIPFINFACSNLFGRTGLTKRAILEQGWNPLILLNHETLQTKYPQLLPTEK